MMPADLRPVPRIVTLTSVFTAHRVGAGVQQRGHRVHVSPAGGSTQRQPFVAVTALGVRVGPGCGEDPDDVGPALDARPIQRGGAVPVGHTGVGPGT